MRLSGAQVRSVEDNLALIQQHSDAGIAKPVRALVELINDLNESRTDQEIAVLNFITALRLYDLIGGGK